MGPHQGRKAFTLQTLPPSTDTDDPYELALAKAAGFSLHCGVAAAAHQREKLERLCRYISRPAIAIERLSLTREGNIRYRLKTPYRDGTTHIVLEPLDFIARLAALVPAPRVNLTRFHGIFAPNHNLRAQVTPARRGPRRRPGSPRTAAERHAAMTWAQRLKRVFSIDIDTCSRCGGAVRIIASIEDPAVIKQILAHLDQQSGQPPPAVTHPVRAPPPELTH